MAPDALADPTGAVIREFGLEAERDLVARWGELIRAKFDGSAVPDIRTGQSNPHPMAVDLMRAFGPRVYEIRNRLQEYHRAAFEARMIRQGIG